MRNCFSNVKNTAVVLKNETQQKTETQYKTKENTSKKITKKKYLKKKTNKIITVKVSILFTHTTQRNHNTSYNPTQGTNLIFQPTLMPNN